MGTELTEKEIDELPVPDEIKQLMKDAVSGVKLLQRQVAGSIELAYWRGKQERGMSEPIIVCLCGSTRFVDTYNEWRKKLTLDGKIVLSIELVLPQSEREDPQHNNYKVKQMLDELHLRKIDLADEVMILNVGGYIGNSTRAEIEYATKIGKPIKYLET